MTRIKVFELARQLNISSRELCAVALGAGLAITSASRLLSAAEEQAIRESVATRPPPRRAPELGLLSLGPVAADRAEYGACACCGRSAVALVKARVPDGLPAKIRICVRCAAHQGDHHAARTQRERDHQQP